MPISKILDVFYKINKLKISNIMKLIYSTYDEQSYIDSDSTLFNIESVWMGRCSQCKVNKIFIIKKI